MKSAVISLYVSKEAKIANIKGIHLFWKYVKGWKNMEKDTIVEKTKHL